MKPFINLDELELIHRQDGELFQESYAVISEKIGAQKLGYSLTILPPGKRVCPYHNHRVLEEMFLILEGTGTLRFGNKEYPLRPHDVIACPPGDREVAHQIVNTGTVDLKFFALSTKADYDVCEYPDSDKMGIFGGGGKLLFPLNQAVDYYHGEGVAPDVA